MHYPGGIFVYMCIMIQLRVQYIINRDLPRKMTRSTKKTVADNCVRKFVNKMYFSSIFNSVFDLKIVMLSKGK